ncbi:formate dehydrogenase subunit gamma [Ramlibacter sp.]|uniref:formate dehydrogenase subunit gamma n=1 Tax=Ramlibacter sp. TaxID=1917967 RepID=UPI002D720CFF|nr:formate dehydrogenase subunit gamma [Ramlibacter sp.]HYD77472.1 formate dehydrogenase subunit gamma [Ramlibacter sp.]
MTTPRSTELFAAALLALAALVVAPAAAQAPAQQGQSSATQPAPARSLDDPAPAPGGIQGQNIFEVKPEVKRDASSEPGYMDQDNGQRNAVQPGNNSPMWRKVKDGIEGYSSLPQQQAPEAGVLIQEQVQYPGSRPTTAGEAWRQVRNNWLIPYGGALLLIAIGALAIYYFARGPLGHQPAVGGGGRRIERFTPFERAAHWANAIAFVLLAVSGIIMAFGRAFLLPLIGQTLFGWLTYALKNIHNFAGPLFAVSLVVVIITFIKDEFPQRGDLRWLARAGGAFSKDRHEPPSHRFNAGEKVLFWIAVLVLGLVAVGSGLVLDHLIPGIDYVRGTMQQAHMIHATATILMMAMMTLHIYLGTIGMRGAYDAMRHGWVDEAWAQEHHAYWHEAIQAGRVPAVRSSQSREPGAAPEQVRPA